MDLSKAMRKLLPLTAGLTFALISIAESILVPAIAAERWVRLVSDYDSATYIDTASIRGRGRYRYYWQQVAFSRPQPITTYSIGSARRVPVYGLMYYVSVDCRTKIARLRRFMVLDKNNRIIMDASQENYGPLANLNRSRSLERLAANYACARRGSRR